MKHIKTFESRIYVDIRVKKEDLVEVWELDDDKDKIISGYSTMLSEDEINELVEMGLIFYDEIEENRAEPVFYESDRDEVENFLELKRNANTYNL